MRTARGMVKPRAIFAASIALLWLGGCTVGPRYEKPAVETPPDWRWKKAALFEIARNGEWWQVFGDSRLDALESMALETNQDLKLAIARIDEARAIARISKADFYPQLSSSPSIRRSGDSANTFLPGAAKGIVPGLRAPHTLFSFPVDFSYEVDAWGRIRKTFNAEIDRAEASVADYHTAILTVTGDVAVNYFLLRSLDTEAQVLQNTLELRKKSLELVNSQFKFGAIDALDVARAKTDVSTTEAGISDVARRRAEAVNVIAILCGKPASSFSIDVLPLSQPPPEIPAALPSTLLERRPDVVAAERRLAATSEEIGVARTAFFPRFALTAETGFQSQEITSIFNWQSTLWTVAGNMVQPVFTGGRNKANLEAAHARYNEAEAVYKQQVLVAFKDVEDALGDLKFLAEQAKSQDEAIASAREVTKLATKRYENGQVIYLDVVDALRQQLQIEQTAAQILGQRLAATVRLIKSLGGGW